MRPEAARSLESEHRRRGERSRDKRHLRTMPMYDRILPITSCAGRRDCSDSFTIVGH
jgi:hypothetical protein